MRTSLLTGIIVVVVVIAVIAAISTIWPFALVAIRITTSETATVQTVAATAPTTAGPVSTTHATNHISPGGAETVGCTTVKWPDQSPVQVDRYIMQINMWNLKNASGRAEMSYCNGAFAYSQDFTGIVEKNPNSWVAGYPEVWIGYKPWAGLSTPGTSFPLVVSDVLKSNITIEVEYEVTVPDQTLPFDFAFDIWVTKTPYQRSVGSGEQEIMIWLYHQQLNPAGSQIGVVTIPIFINGSLVNATFKVFKQQSMPWEYVAFVLDPPLRSASMAFKLADFVRAASSITALQNYNNMWVDDVEIGSEFGSPSTTEASFKWTLKFDVKS